MDTIKRKQLGQWVQTAEYGQYASARLIRQKMTDRLVIYPSLTVGCWLCDLRDQPRIKKLVTSRIFQTKFPSHTGYNFNKPWRPTVRPDPLSPIGDGPSVIKQWLKQLDTRVLFIRSAHNFDDLLYSNRWKWTGRESKWLTRIFWVVLQSSRQIIHRPSSSFLFEIFPFLAIKTVRWLLSNYNSHFSIKGQTEPIRQLAGKVSPINNCYNQIRYQRHYNPLCENKIEKKKWLWED